jgi:hypothetical protein
MRQSSTFVQSWMGMAASLAQRWGGGPREIVWRLDEFLVPAAIAEDVQDPDSRKVVELWFGVNVGPEWITGFVFVEHHLDLRYATEMEFLSPPLSTVNVVKFRNDSQHAFEVFESNAILQEDHVHLSCPENGMGVLSRPSRKNPMIRWADERWGGVFGVQVRIFTPNTIDEPPLWSQPEPSSARPFEFTGALEQLLQTAE